MLWRVPSSAAARIVKCFVPPLSKPNHLGSESLETQYEDSTSHLVVMYIPEERIQNMQDSLNSILECSYYVLPGEVPVEPVGVSA